MKECRLLNIAVQFPQCRRHDMHIHAAQSQPWLLSLSAATDGQAPTGSLRSSHALCHQALLHRPELLDRLLMLLHARRMSGCRRRLGCRQRRCSRCRVRGAHLQPATARWRSPAILICNGDPTHVKRQQQRATAPYAYAAAASLTAAAIGPHKHALEYLPPSDKSRHSSSAQHILVCITIHLQFCIIQPTCSRQTRHSSAARHRFKVLRGMQTVLLLYIIIIVVAEMPTCSRRTRRSSAAPECRHQ